MDTGDGLPSSVSGNGYIMKSYGRGLSQWKQVFQGNVFAFGLISFITDLSTEMIYPLLPVFFNGLIYDNELILKLKKINFFIIVNVIFIV